jgi:hypothetical protein
VTSSAYEPAVNSAKQQGHQQRRPQRTAHFAGQHSHERVDTRTEDIAEDEQEQQRPGDPAFEFAVGFLVLLPARRGLRRHGVRHTPRGRARKPAGLRGRMKSAACGHSFHHD